MQLIDNKHQTFQQAMINVLETADSVGIAHWIL